MARRWAFSLSINARNGRTNSEYPRPIDLTAHQGHPSNLALLWTDNVDMKTLAGHRCEKPHVDFLREDGCTFFQYREVGIDDAWEVVQMIADYVPSK